MTSGIDTIAACINPVLRLVCLWTYPSMKQAGALGLQLLWNFFHIWARDIHSILNRFFGFTYTA